LNQEIIKIQFKLDFKSFDFFFLQRLFLTKFLTLFPKILFNKTAVPLLLGKKNLQILCYFSSSTNRNLTVIIILSVDG